MPLPLDPAGLRPEGFEPPVPLLDARARDAVCRSLEAALTGARVSARDVLDHAPGIVAGLRAARPGLALGVVAATFQDKRPGRRWGIPWHRDVIVRTRSRRRFRAPRSTLERTLAVHVHLDDVDAGAGALQVLPGSHRVPGEPAAGSAPGPDEPRAILGARAGEAIVMSPLLVHRSARPAASFSGRRRIVHLLVAPRASLPRGERWETFVELPPA